MIVKATCAMCKKGINLIIDDEYAKLRAEYRPGTTKVMDALMGIVGRAICNRCGDYREDALPIEERIKKICMKMFNGSIGKKEQDKTREVLTTLCQKYMRIVSDYKATPIPIWDSEIVEAMLRTPGNFSIILSDVRKMCAQPTLV